MTLRRDFALSRHNRQRCFLGWGSTPLGNNGFCVLFSAALFGGVFLCMVCVLVLCSISIPKCKLNCKTWKLCLDELYKALAKWLVHENFAQTNFTKHSPDGSRSLVEKPVRCAQLLCDWLSPTTGWWLGGYCEGIFGCAEWRVHDGSHDIVAEVAAEFVVAVQCYTVHLCELFFIRFHLLSLM
jgi:hypothetical protein